MRTLPAVIDGPRKGLCLLDSGYCHYPSLERVSRLLVVLLLLCVSINFILYTLKLSSSNEVVCLSIAVTDLLQERKRQMQTIKRWIEDDQMRLERKKSKQKEMADLKAKEVRGALVEMTMCGETL